MPDNLTPEDVAYLLNVPEDFKEHAIKIIKRYGKQCWIKGTDSAHRAFNPKYKAK